MMSVSSNAVWHLIVIHIAKLVLLRRDIGLDTSCIGAVQCVYMIQIRVVFHFVGHDVAIWRE